MADFYNEVMDALASVGMPVEINVVPNEIADAIAFPDDTMHASYDGDHAQILWRALLDAHRVLTRHRAGFLGKASPVHFFWGSFDLATTRFSGRLAPPHPGGLPNFPADVAREAYSHELASCGFWPGDREAPEPVFYAYAYPTPPGYPDADVEPGGASWNTELGEFVLPYRAVAQAEDPDDILLAFAQSTHAAAADLAGWDRARLESSYPHGPDWWRTRPAGGHNGQVTDRQISFRHDPALHRYVAEMGGTVVGKVVYQRSDDRLIFVHTEVDEDLQGQGIASQLARHALDDARASTSSVVALCPFIAGWIDHHPDYVDLVVDQGSPQRG